MTTTATATTALVNNDHGNPPSSCSLVPVRVDVISDDGSIRIVDTMLWDPHCWPIALSGFSSLSEGVEANVQSMAYNLVADLEVHGMGRTQRHFTGRVELWSPQLQAKVADQLRPQLLQIARDYCSFGAMYGALSSNDIGKTATQDTSITIASDEVEQPSSASQDAATAKSTTATTPTCLREIPIRLDFNGILIQDDVMWCDTPSSSSSSHSPTNCPVAISKSITKDLRLPDDAAVAVCTALVEQIHGTTSVESIDATTFIPKAKWLDAASGSSSSLEKKRVTGAWTMDQRDHLVKVSYLVAVHKPSAATTSATVTPAATTASSMS
jgi:hypothetical protein